MTKMLFRLILALVVIYLMINIAIQNKLQQLFTMTMKTVFLLNWSHTASLSRLYFVKVVRIPAIFGLRFIIICLKTFWILSSSISTILLLPRYISANCLSPLHPYILSASSLKLANTLFLVTNLKASFPYAHALLHAPNRYCKVCSNKLKYHL